MNSSATPVSLGKKPSGPDLSPYGMVEPYEILRTGPRRDVKIEPQFSIPSLVHIEITYACMEDCIMCYNPTRTPATDRDKDEVWRIVKRLADARVPHTYLIGGEPTYGYKYHELSDMVEYLSDHGSSVTIVTNGQITLKDMSPRLACFGVSLHSHEAAVHDAITQTPGAFDKALRTARSYIERGFDVRIIPVVMGMNHDHMYKIAEIAWEIGAESVYYDIYEPGGIGEINSADQTLRMQPTQDELRHAIGEIVQAHDDFPFRGSVGLGTAMPYCFDERLVERGMLANCGVGTYFGAVTNVGEFRICNQSKMNFGNVLERDLSDIWLDPRLDSYYRELKWVDEPCSSCAVLGECGGGCKVDEGCASGELCIDRVVRGLSPELQLRLEMADIRHGRTTFPPPDAPRTLRCSPYLDVTDLYREMGDLFFKTRYQTVRIDEDELTILRSILSGPQVFKEESLLGAYADYVEPTSLTNFVSGLIEADALEVV